MAVCFLFREPFLCPRFCMSTGNNQAGLYGCTSVKNKWEAWGKSLAKTQKFGAFLGRGEMRALGTGKKKGERKEKLRGREEK